MILRVVVSMFGVVVVGVFVRRSNGLPRIMANGLARAHHGLQRQQHEDKQKKNDFLHVITLT